MATKLTSFKPDPTSATATSATATTEKYLKSQIITYMGNKRKLLTQIGDIVDLVKYELGCQRLKTADAFAGSGIVSRLLKNKSDVLLTNDISSYSKTLNHCYLSTPSANIKQNIKKYIMDANKFVDNVTSMDCNIPKWIQLHWAPTSETQITKDDRVFFTAENGRRIDKYRYYINTYVPNEFQHFLLANLLVKCSIHNNTNGQFSAFYKDERGIGKYGGKKEIDIKRIITPIQLEMPIFSPNSCNVRIYQEDTNSWVKKIESVDLIYLDPPYNKHPYSIYYFMLDIINNWNTNDKIPDTNRGQPKNWRKSDYNSFTKAESAFRQLIHNIKAKYILLSYNNKGIIPINTIEQILETRGKLYKFPLTHKTYNKLKGIATYKRKVAWDDVKEYLWLVKCDVINVGNTTTC